MYDDVIPRSAEAGPLPMTRMQADALRAEVGRLARAVEAHRPRPWRRRLLVAAGVAALLFALNPDRRAHVVAFDTDTSLAQMAQSTYSAPSFRRLELGLLSVGLTRGRVSTVGLLGRVLIVGPTPGLGITRRAGGASTAPPGRAGRSRRAVSGSGSSMGGPTREAARRLGHPLGAIGGTPP